MYPVAIEPLANVKKKTLNQESIPGNNLKKIRIYEIPYKIPAPPQNVENHYKKVSAAIYRTTRLLNFKG